MIGGVVKYLFVGLFLLYGSVIGQESEPVEQSNPKSFGVSAGLYSLDGTSSVWHGELHYSYYLPSTRWYVEFVLGGGPVEDTDISNGSLTTRFENSLLLSYGIAGVYRVSGGSKTEFTSGEYLFGTSGLQGVYVGGSHRLALVLGFGYHYQLYSSESMNLALRLDAKDQLYTQSVGGSSEIWTNNLVLLLGVQCHLF
ncbi:MAG: hypothetical protein OCD76_09020 [Reichenbachiella sp.]